MVAAAASGSAKALVFGRRSACREKISRSGTARSELLLHDRRAGGQGAPFPRRHGAAPSRRRSPNAAIAATFSVPARRFRSCPPPRTNLSSMFASRARSARAPTPLGPPILWAEKNSASASRASARQSMRPAPCTASQTSNAAVGVDQRGGLAHGLHGAGLVVGGLKRQHDAGLAGARQHGGKRVEIDDRRPRRAERCAPDRRESDGLRARRRARPRSRTARSSGRSPGRTNEGVSTRLAASVPPDVNVTPPGATPASAATRARAASISARARRLRREWRRDCRTRRGTRPTRRAPPAEAATWRSSRDRRADASC